MFKHILKIEECVSVILIDFTRGEVSIISPKEKKICMNKLEKKSKLAT